MAQDTASIYVNVPGPQGDPPRAPWHPLDRRVHWGDTAAAGSAGAAGTAADPGGRKVGGWDLESEPFGGKGLHLADVGRLGSSDAPAGAAAAPRGPMRDCWPDGDHATGRQRAIGGGTGGRPHSAPNRKSPGRTSSPCRPRGNLNATKWTVPRTC